MAGWTHVSVSIKRSQASRGYQGNSRPIPLARLVDATVAWQTGGPCGVLGCCRCARLLHCSGAASGSSCPVQPTCRRLADRHKAPGYVDVTGGVHWLGTDHQGRDVLSRVIHGAQVSLMIGYAGVSLGALIGIALGVWAGYRGGRFDHLAMRVVDAQLSFPYILLAIVWAVTIGSGVLNLLAIIVVRGWVEFARVGRGQALAIRERDYISAVRALGGDDWRIIRRHVLPNIMTPLLVVAGFQLGRLILLEATLSFLGLGVEPRTPAWGSMLADARGYMNLAWWTVTFPGAAIALVVLAANFMGDSLRDRLDPMLHRQL